MTELGWAAWKALSILLFLSLRSVFNKCQGERSFGGRGWRESHSEMLCTQGSCLVLFSGPYGLPGIKPTSVSCKCLVTAVLHLNFQNQDFLV